MDYKKIFRSKSLRLRILAALSWVPDSIMIPLQYRIHTGHRLNIKHPQRFTEKIQIYKMRYRNPDMLRCTDKYHVRKFVEEQGLKDILIPLIGVYENPKDIVFSELPNQFVAKLSDGGGGGQVVVCRDKSKLSEYEFYKQLDGWMKIPKPRKHFGREWAYQNGYKRTIVVEDLISEPGTTDLKDYKFFCFNGKVRMVYGIYGRTNENGANIGFYDVDFKKLDVTRNDERPSDRTLPKPVNYDKMLAVAEKLSARFPHVRVDLYNVEGNVYFGELTFYDGSGYFTCTPDSFDFELGEYFDI